MKNFNPYQGNNGGDSGSEIEQAMTEATGDKSSDGSLDED